MEKDLLKMNLQYFAEDPEGSEGDDLNDQEDGDQGEEDEKMVSVAEMKRRLEKEQDRAEERISEEQKKLEDELEKKLDEAEKLRKMNEKEKQEYEQEKKDDRIAELEAQLNRQGLEREATSMLAEQGVTASEYDLKVVVGKSADDTAELVKNYAQRIDELANKKLEEYKKGTSPRSINAGARKNEGDKKSRADIFREANILKK